MSFDFADRYRDKIVTVQTTEGARPALVTPESIPYEVRSGHVCMMMTCEHICGDEIHLDLPDGRAYGEHVGRTVDDIVVEVVPEILGTLQRRPYASPGEVISPFVDAIQDLELGETCLKSRLHRIIGPLADERVLRRMRRWHFARKAKPRLLPGSGQAGDPLVLARGPDAWYRDGSELALVRLRREGLDRRRDYLACIAALGPDLTKDAESVVLKTVDPEELVWIDDEGGFALDDAEIRELCQELREEAQEVRGD